MRLNCGCPLCRYDRLQRRLQRRWLDRPLPWWRRYTLWDWMFVAVCLGGAAACVWLVVRG